MFIYTFVFSCFCSEWSDYTVGSVGKYGIDGGYKVIDGDSKIALNYNNLGVKKNLFKQFVRLNLINNGKESDPTGFIGRL